MNWWQGIVLGLVQGITEFLPISSSGHLVVAEATLGINTPGVLVEVVLHVATLMAVVIVYRNALVSLTTGIIARDRKSLRYVVLLALGTIPAGLVGVFFKDVIETAFDSLLLVGVNFLVTGAILWSTRSRVGVAVREETNAGGAFTIGLAQAMAILPGISRSGSTVAAAMWLGVDAERAAQFSFLLAIPVIAGAAILQIPDAGADMAGMGLVPLTLGFVAALLSGIASIRILVALLKRGAFHRFAPYCWGLGLITILVAAVA